MIDRIKHTAASIRKFCLPACATDRVKNAVRNAVVSTIEDLEGRCLMSGVFGMNIGDNAANHVDRNSAVMKSMGVKSVRVWVTVDNFNARDFEPPMQRAIDYANKGFDVMLIVNTGKGRVPDPSKVQGWFKWAIGNSALKNAVDRWQIGNEPDHHEYFNGSLSQYVNTFLKPAAQILRPAGEKVVSAGPSWNSQDVQKMIDAGLLNYVDFVGYHPYSNSVKLQAQRIREINEVVAGRKPIVASEWNVYEDTSNKTNWANAIVETYPAIRDGFAYNYYFNLIAGHPSRSGPAGIITKSGVKTQFYNALKSAVAGHAPSTDASKPTTKPTPKPTKPTPAPAPKPTPPAKPAKPAKPAAPKPTAPAKPATPKPTTPKPSAPAVVATPGKHATPKVKVTKLSLFNADTDKIIHGFTDLDNGDTLDLADIGTRNIAIVAETGGARSVRFRFNGANLISEVKPFAAFGTRKGDGDDLRGMKVLPGSYALHATAFAGHEALGAASSTISMTLNVVNSANKASAIKPKPAVTALQLQDARTGLAIPGYERMTAATIVRLAKLPTRSLRVAAITNDAVDSIKLTGFGPDEKQNDSPFRSTNVYVNRGKYYVEATAFGSDNLSGDKGNTLGFTVRFV